MHAAKLIAKMFVIMYKRLKLLARFLAIDIQSRHLIIEMVGIDLYSHMHFELFKCMNKRSMAMRADWLEV